MKSARVLVSCLVLGCGFAAVAQDSQPDAQPAKQPAAQPGGQPGGPGPRGPREGGGRMAPALLTAEQSAAAWKFQSEGVAASLGLDSEKTATLAKTYHDARASNLETTEKLRKEIAEKREQGEEGRAAIGELQQKLLEAARTSRESFEKALAGVLTPEQVTKAMSSLGTFNRQWDVMSDAVLGFKLDAAKQAEATKAMQTYVESMNAGRRGAGPGEGAGPNMAEARAALTDAMKKVLSDEQFGKFQAATGMGGRRGGGQGGGGQGGGGGGGEGEPRRRPGGG